LLGPVPLVRNYLTAEKEMDLMVNNNAEVLTIHFTKIGSGMGGFRIRK
jgi:hypothetical protein